VPSQTTVVPPPPLPALPGSSTCLIAIAKPARLTGVKFHGSFPPRGSARVGPADNAATKQTNDVNAVPNFRMALT
jgi:hypothetical protein